VNTGITKIKAVVQVAGNCHEIYCEFIESSGLLMWKHRGKPLLLSPARCIEEATYTIMACYGDSVLECYEVEL
jgi:hypothetical protein